jgi:GTP-binding protein
MNFIDIATVEVSSGKGGAGHISFRREKFVPKGGPDGGNGGKGGDVIFKADPHMNTLLDFRFKRILKAEAGHVGMKYNKTGRDGQDLIVKVPTGTIIKDLMTQEIIGDLSQTGQEVVIARGGRGGRGNAEFTSSINRAPRHAEPGEPAEELTVILELKLLADVGLVGFPNAGKSTLISVMSAAKPKIADYPFTTLVPNLGVVRIGDEQSYTIADIPGLIEGAHEGKGLGMQFLRHVERTRVLVFLIDAASENVVHDYDILKNELHLYNTNLDDKKRIILLTKADTIDEEKRELLKDVDFGEPDAQVMIISSVTGEGIDELKWTIWKKIQISRALEQGTI